MKYIKKEYGHIDCKGRVKFDRSDIKGTFKRFEVTTSPTGDCVDKADDADIHLFTKSDVQLIVDQATKAWADTTPNTFNKAFEVITEKEFKDFFPSCNCKCHRIYQRQIVQ
jgi:hypothetical protein